MKKLTELIQKDIEDIILGELDYAMLHRNHWMKEAIESRTKISELNITLNTYKSLLRSTQEMLRQQTKLRQETESLYNELKVLYDAGVKHDILKPLS